MNVSEITAAIELGLIYGLVAVGVYISFRILDFPDMTVDGSFPMGAGIAAVLILSGHDPWLATLIAMIGGAAAGLVTACLNVYGRILHLLASILTMTALYSVNLRIMGAPNLGLLNEVTIFQNIDTVLQSMGIVIAHKTSVILLTFILLTAVVLGLFWFLSTQTGLAMRATGKNKQMATAQGIHINTMILVGIALSNSLYALSGAIFAQSQAFADVNMGPGTIIVGLAAVIIGEAVVHSRSVILAMVACVMGAIAYYIVIGLALNSDILGLETSDLKLVAAVLIATAMVLSHVRHSVKRAVLSTRQKMG
jgi:putative tryptophan/tyrosine transport system permease protein